MKRIVALGLLLLAAAGATAQPFPSRTIRLVNPFPAGGPLDLVGRPLAERLSAALGVAVIVENKPGAAGNVGAAEVAKSAPDGHTVLLGLFSITATNPHLYAKSAFDALKDFAPVTLIATYDSVLIVHASVPASNVKELIAYARANPGRLNYASAGKASPGHITGELFNRRAGVQLTHVPYKGNAPAVQSVVAGETQVMFTPTTGALPHIRAGRLKALAVYLTDRAEELPGVTSIGAQGVEGFDAKAQPSWYGLLVPSGTPRDVVARLHAETAKALKDEKVATAFKAARIFTVGAGPEEFAQVLKDSHAAWGRIIAETGIKGE
jgi:tripartite-type tricarboxylate transporter receptor subunit TctC